MEIGLSPAALGLQCPFAVTADRDYLVDGEEIALYHRQSS